MRTVATQISPPLTLALARVRCRPQALSCGVNIPVLSIDKRGTGREHLNWYQPQFIPAEH